MSTRKSVKSQKTQAEQRVYKRFIHELGSLILARGFLLAPLERMKIILQTKHIANFSNPSDRPKGTLDLGNSKSIFLITS